MKTKLFSMLVAMIALFGVLSASISAAYITKYEDNNNFIIIPFDDSITTGAAIYENFNSATDTAVSSDGVLPYGKAFNLLEQAELFTWFSDGDNITVGIADDIGLKETTNKSGSEYSITKNELTVSTSQETSPGILASPLESLCYATGVAFDPTGCGRRNHVAVLGYYNKGLNSGSYLFIFREYKDGNTTKYQYIQGEQLSAQVDHTWMYYGSSLDLDNVDAGNFFQITAGDYNGDGKDSLIIYNGTVNVEKDENNKDLYIGLTQVDYDGSINITGISVNGTTQYLNKAWFDANYHKTTNTYNTRGEKDSRNLNKRLNVCLATGDVNGDGIDDLAVVSCTGGLTKDELQAAGNRLDLVKTSLAVGIGATGTSNIGDLSVKTSTVFGDEYTMAAPGVSIGDIDSDGNNEIVIGGFANKVTEKNPRNIQNNKIAFTYYKYSQNALAQQNGVQVYDKGNFYVSPICYDDSVRRGQEYLWQQFSVECVYFDNSAKKDYVFLNGYVYQLNTSTKKLEYVDVYSAVNTRIFGTDTTNMYGDGDNKYDVDEIFILSAAVGNFTGDANGQESLALTVGFKVNESKSSDKGNNAYYIGEIFITKCNINGSSNKGKLVGSSINIKTSFSTRSNEGVYVQSKDNPASYSGFNNFSFIRVACDVGYDSVVGNYAKTEAFYSDPEVIAVLQAPPYFQELDYGNSATVYSYSMTYGKSESEGYDFTVGFGICASVDSPVVKFELEETIKSGLTEEFENSVETTYTTTFEASGQNQVIMRRILLYVYYYSIMDENGNFPTDKDTHLISVVVPKNPTVTALSFKQYDAYADYYNQEVDKVYNDPNSNCAYWMNKYYNTAKLNTIDNNKLAHYYLLNNEGNPYGYASSLNDYNNAFSMAKNDTWVNLSSASGTITQEFQNAVGESYTKSTSVGVEVNMKLMGGTSVFGTGLYAGVTAGMEYIHENSTTTSTVNTVTTSGTVQGIDSGLDDYAFDWQLIGWRSDSGCAMFNDSSVLFVGYLVKVKRSAPQPVTDLKATYSSDNNTVTLTWTSPDIASGRHAVDNFLIYRDGERIGGMIDCLGEGKEHTYTVDVSNADSASIDFYVVSRGYYTSFTKKSYVDSIESNTATAILALTKQQTTQLIESMLEDLKTKTAELEEALAKKPSAEDLESKITELTNAYKEADELLGKEIDAAKSEIESLKTATESALEALRMSVAAVKSDIADAVYNLKSAIALGDAQNASAITDLSNAYKAADALLSADIDAAESEIADLKAATESALEALRESIAAVKSELADAVSGLNAAIASGDSDNADAIAKLTDAYKAADALLGADIDAAEGEIASLKAATDEALAALGNSIDVVKTDLDSAIEALNAAIASGDTQNAETISQKISEINKQLTDAYDLLAKENASLKSELDSARESLGAEIESVKLDLSNLQAQLNEQAKKHESDIRSVTEVGDERNEEQNTTRTVAVIGLSVATVSMLGNAGLVASSIIGKKKNLK